MHRNPAPPNATPRSPPPKLPSKLLKPTLGPLSTLLRRAHQHRSAGQWPAAIALYRQCLSEDPHSLDTRYNLAWCLHASGQHADAAALCRRVLASRADFWQNALVLGQSLQALQQFHKADQA